MNEGLMTEISAAATDAAQTEKSVLRVTCLCAAWCTTCREYRQTFDELAVAYPHASFRWLDIEDEAEALGDLDVENFPTLLVARDGVVLFFGVLLPHKSHLARMVENFLLFSDQEVSDYGRSSSERTAWQNNPDIVRLGDW